MQKMAQPLRVRIWANKYSSEASTSQSTKTPACNEKHPRRKALNDAIVTDLMVGYSLPVSTSVTKNFESHAYF